MLVEHSDKISLAKNNKYDKLLIFFIIFQVFGVFGGPFQPIRFLILSLIPSMYVYFILYKENRKKYRYEIFLFTIWLIYAILSLLFTQKLGESIKETIYLFINFNAFFIVIFLALRSNKPIQSLVTAWLYLFLLTTPVALIELFADIHLPMSVVSEDYIMKFGSDIFHRNFASVTFGNLNGYNTILTYILPFSFGMLLSIKKENKKQKRLFSFTLAILIFIIFSNSSRATIIILFIISLIYLNYSIKNKKWFFIILLGISLLIALIVYIYFDYFGLIFLRFADQGLADDGRSRLLSSGLDALTRSGFIGVGAGNFQPIMDNVYHLKLTSAHNFFLEVGVQYGIIIFILFLGLFVRILTNTKTNTEKSVRFITFASIITFPMSSIINSGYLLNVWVWIYIASLYVVSDATYSKR